MAKTKPSLNSSFQGTSTYQISIKGFLDNRWSERLAGMKINHYETESGSISTLIGKIIDQSELFGVLNILNDYHYKIISVNKINN
jgi:hypothetical protein